MAGLTKKGKQQWEVCKYCGYIMQIGESCNPTLLHKGLLYKRIPWDQNFECHDCNVTYGQYHHLGCDLERCPLCKKQLIGCGCFEYKKEAD